MSKNIYLCINDRKGAKAAHTPPRRGKAGTNPAAQPGRKADLNKHRYTTMKIILIGAGRLAYQLGRALLTAGHDIMQVYSRTMESARQVADMCGGSPTNRVSEIKGDADVYIVAVKDSAMPELIPQICKGREQKVFLHTAGSVAMDIFKGMALHYGVLYPLQTFSKERDVDFSSIPCLVEANDDFAASAVVDLAGSISSKVWPMSSDDRKQVHLAAIFACNFANHCYTLASDILARHGIPFDIMLPLIDETARKVHSMPPAEAQTGPAMRYDENIIRDQSRSLAYDPLAKEIYDRMSISIHRKAKSND